MPTRAANHLWQFLDALNFLFYSGIPLLIIIVSNAGLLYVVIKSSRTLNHSSLIIVVSLSILLVISWMPVTMYAILVKSKRFYWYRVAHYVLTLDITLSPFLYCYFNKTFRNFACNVFSCSLFLTNTNPPLNASFVVSVA